MRYNSELPPSDKNAFIYKGGQTGTEYVLPSEVGKHMPYDPRQLPSLLGPVDIDDGMVVISHADQKTNMDPLITWYNESWAKAVETSMPIDHGIAFYPEPEHNASCCCETCRFWS